MGHGAAAGAQEWASAERLRGQSAALGHAAREVPIAIEGHQARAPEPRGFRGFRRGSREKNRRNGE